MTVVSDSSPLISLSKTGRLDLLQQLYRTILINPEVYAEVVVAGAGLMGSSQVAIAPWIEVRQSENTTEFLDALRRSGLGLGEIGAILLARELKADLLETGFALKLIPDLTEAYRHLLTSGAHVNRKILDASLKALSLRPL